MSRSSVPACRRAGPALAVVVTVTVAAAALPGCASNTVKPEEILSTEPDAPVLVFGSGGGRRSGFSLLLRGPCERSLVGGMYSGTRRFGLFGVGADPSGQRVRPDHPYVVSYTQGSSNVICHAMGMTAFQRGKRYRLDGEGVYSEGLLPVFQGCRLKVVDVDTGQAVPLLPAGIDPVGQACKPGDE